MAAGIDDKTAARKSPIPRRIIGDTPDLFSFNVKQRIKLHKEKSSSYYWHRIAIHVPLAEERNFAGDFMKPSLYKKIPTMLCLMALSAGPALAASPGPIPAAPTPPIPAPEDKPFPGTIQLSIDATDIDRKVVRVHEVIPATAGDLTLLYPKWLPGTHAPEGAIDRFAALTVTANGQKVDWVRDPVDVYAFHLTVPAGTTKLDIRMVDMDAMSYNHGGGKVDFKGQQSLPYGAFRYSGPCPPMRHSYRFTVKALDASGKTLATAKASKDFPQ